ncbi:MAG: hypothetical protein ACR2LS_10680 [Thermomicrobiales bacterium]
MTNARLIITDSPHELVGRTGGRIPLVAVTYLDVSTEAGSTLAKSNEVVPVARP